MKGGHADNYYYQLVANIRRYKGAAPLPAAAPPRTIAIDGGFNQWSTVAPSYHDDAGDIGPRDHDGASGLHYASRTGRRDFIEFKVARDSRNIAFYARNREPFIGRGHPGGMWLLIDSDCNAETGWNGYDFIVNRQSEGEQRMSVEKNDRAWTWKPVAKAEYRVTGSELQLAIPLAALGLAGGDRDFAIDFKWMDNTQRPGDVMDAYLSGDVAPEGRFRFRYSARASRTTTGLPSEKR